MAKHNVDIGTNPNDQTGDPIRTAFGHVNDNTDELYEGANITATAPLAKTSVADESVTLSISNDSIKEEKLDCTNGATDNYLLSFDNASGGFTWVAGTEGDITAITAGDGLTGSSLTGPVPTLALDSSSAGNGLSFSSGVLAVGVDDSTVELSGDAVRVKDNGITHAKLEDRYTEKTTNSTTTSQTLQADDFTSFILTGNIGTATLTIDDMKTGQVIDIHMTGTLTSAVITLAFDFSSTTINKIGTGAFDQSEKNLIQIVCVDDTDGAAIVNYSVGKITADSNPD